MATLSIRDVRTEEIPLLDNYGPLSLSLIWELNGRTVAFTSFKIVAPEKEAEIQLHLVDPELHDAELGAEWFGMSLKKYFQRHGVEKIVCQPPLGHPLLNGIFQSLGIKPVKHAVTRYEIYGMGATSEQIEALTK